MFVFTETRNIGQIGLNTYIFIIILLFASSSPVCKDQFLRTSLPFYDFQ